MGRPKAQQPKKTVTLKEKVDVIKYKKNQGVEVKLRYLVS